MVSVVWNVYLRSTGRRVTLRHVRQAFVPGVFFGLNLATFFVRGDAQQRGQRRADRVALAVPDRAARGQAFKEYINPRALVFALVAFGGAVIVLFSAPPNGDASLRGNVFGVLAMLLWTGYVVSTRHFRRDMDVATFMATVSPIAAVAVLPLAIANGDVFGMSGTGWIYMLLLTFLTGVAAHGLLVFAQKTIQIGTIGIAQVVQPALAVVWSFLLLGETLRARQMRRHRDLDERPAGVPGGARARRPDPPGRGPVALHGRRAPDRWCSRSPSTRARPCRRWSSDDLPDPAGVGSVEVGDEVGGGLHPPISLLAQVPGRADVAAGGGDAGQRVEGEHLDRGVVRVPGLVEDGLETLPRRLGTRPRRPWPPAGTRRARPAHRRRRGGARQSRLRAPSALASPVRSPAGHGPGAPGRAPPGARRRWPGPCRSRAPGWRRRRRSRRPGTGLDPGS